MKKTVLALYTLLIVCMAAATIIEKMYGTDYVTASIYGSWWFMALWASLAVSSLVFLVCRKVHKRPSVLLLHLAFVGILIGAFVTYLTSQRGTIHLRMDSTEGAPKGISSFVSNEGTSQPLPFALKLTDFQVVNYPGTDAPMDYVSTVATVPTTVPNGFAVGQIAPVPEASASGIYSISMNNIADIQGYRFYQSSYDEDLQGSHMLVYYDPYGIAITYTSYALLLISILAISFQKLRRRMLIALLLAVFAQPSSLFATVPEVSTSGKYSLSHDLCDIAVLYNGRICPLNTAATDFVQKLSGKSSWEGLSADEIFVGWMIYYDEWERKPIIKVKSGKVQSIIGISDSWASLRDFYTQSNEYKLQPYLNDGSLSASDRKAIREADEKVCIVSMFYAGEFTRIFPLQTSSAQTSSPQIHWYSPGSTDLPKDIPEKEFQFIKHSMDYLVEAILAGDNDRAETLIAKLKNYQSAHAPIPQTLAIERFYNKLLSQRMPVFIFLTLSLLLCIASFITPNHHHPQRFRRWSQNRIARYALRIAHYALPTAIFLYLTLSITLRWIVSGHVPLSNGFETMQFMAWLVITMTLLSSITHYSLRITHLSTLGPLVSSFAMLVSVLACGSPQLTPLMPVLQSPLLAIHVLMVMIAYSLFAILTLISLQALCQSKAQIKNHTSYIKNHKYLLFPAVALLTIGIFTGAVWANVSWGRYWGWDPKETWALITLMIYAIPLHKSLFTTNVRAYHIYMIFAFLAVIITYFGVNFFLSGMHSYA
ncbi:MAG: cytochrome c biogenesis protein CcsA [Bacteroidaceae bacterium]|nr:cytochrome c biogenesis protein CcsA [Bacteroidaceae bacterium]